MWCEMGSGKGKLSQQLYEELDESSHHLLVDRDAFKGTHVVYTDEKMEGRSGDKSNIDQSGRVSLCIMLSLRFTSLQRTPRKGIVATSAGGYPPPQSCQGGFPPSAPQQSLVRMRFENKMI